MPLLSRPQSRYDIEKGEKGHSSPLHRHIRVIKGKAKFYLILLALLVLGYIFLAGTHGPSHATAALHSQQLPITSTSRILILQHIYPTRPTRYQTLKNGVLGRDENALYEASVQSHKKYAGVWGFGYRVEFGSRLSGDTKQSKHLSKVYVLLESVLEELAKGSDGAEWIMFADADTLIANPSVELTTLLPPSKTTPQPLILSPPLILGNIDHRGFNAGVMVVKVSIELASFLFSMITNEVDLFAKTGKHPSDQHLWGYTLQQSQHADIASRFYLIPQRWLNSYWLEGSSPALHVHLVNQRKWQEDWKNTVIGRAEAMYSEVGELGKEGLEMMTDWHLARDEADVFWLKAKGGIKDVLFNEI